MKVNWKELWDANKNIFVVSGWEECPEDKRKAWHLPSQYSYFSSGDMNLRVGIVAANGPYKEEDFLLGGILWGNRLGNGVRTVIYFVATDFTPVFLGSVARLGGVLSGKAVYWREKLTPSLFPVLEKDYHTNLTHRIDLGELRPNWVDWERQLNPVAWNHLKIIRNYLEGFSKRRVRVVFGKNKIIYSWGNIEILEIKQKGNKFEMATKVKWTRNKSIATKFQKSGWVDIAGNINDEFCRAITGIIELLENMEINGSLDARELLFLKMIYDKEFIPEFLGYYCDCPWIPKGNPIIDINSIMYFINSNETQIVYPILEKPTSKMVNIILTHTALTYCNLQEKGFPNEPDAKWNKKIILLCPPVLKDELRFCQSWLKNPENFPIMILPEEWKTEGLKSIKGLGVNEFSSMYDSYC